MLDIKFIRENPEVVKKAVADKQLVGTVDIDELLKLDRQYLDNLRKVELHRSLHNSISKDIDSIDIIKNSEDNDRTEPMVHFPDRWKQIEKHTDIRLGTFQT